ncbi:hypothetical protein CKAH01_10367 [Colletotrichum kahawae]|uniref:Uncharacterized protein n=1 Tax=Colletotrichum kahawae TaxID=34407 RepID=A0AAD9XW42_COLKA|nr:hypothetical protein CKAH01_10367 [Colletotrichum kahawae]
MITLLTDATDLAGPTHRGHPNAGESASVNPASTDSEELDDSTGSTSESFRLSPTPPPCSIAGSRTSREVSPGRSSSDRFNLGATPESLLGDQIRSGSMLENNPSNAAEASVSVLAGALLDFGMVCGRSIGLLKGSKILVETQMMDLRAEMDKAWPTIGEGRNCGRGFDEIESDLKQLVELKNWHRQGCSRRRKQVSNLPLGLH